MGLLEPSHVILIVIGLLLMFGGKKIPELMKGLGRGIKEFKDAQNGETTLASTTDTSANPTNTNFEEKPKV